MSIQETIEAIKNNSHNMSDKNWSVGSSHLSIGGLLTLVAGYERLREAVERYQSVCDSCGQGKWYHDSEMCRKYVNTTEAALKGE